MVMPRKACIRFKRSSGDTTLPALVVRVAAHHANSKGSVGAIMKSEWNEIFMPLRNKEPQRTICEARSGPKPKLA